MFVNNEVVSFKRSSTIQRYTLSSATSGFSLYFLYTIKFAIVLEHFTYCVYGQKCCSQSLLTINHGKFTGTEIYSISKINQNTHEMIFVFFLKYMA